MCLAVPGKIIEIVSEGLARVDYGSLVATVSLQLVPQARPGQWVLVHAGFAVEVLDEADVRETLSLLQELDAHA